jgi:beta-lactamase regulating signal transducer with metallopeptidase domain
MNSWLPPNLVECLGWTLVHFLWQGCVIAILLAAALRLLRHAAPDRRYLAGCLALLLLVASPLVTFHQIAGRQPANPFSDLEPVSGPLTVDTTSRDLTPLTKRVAAAQVAKNNPGLLQRLETFLPLLVLAWSVGVLALSCRLLGGWLQVRRLKRTATAALDGSWPLKLAALARRLGLRRPVRLLQSALVEVPTVLGWLRPVILLPASCLAGLTPAQLEAILAHELAHIRRHDYLVNLLQSVVETVLFYHPAVWWISRRVREEREHCCDDLAVEICGDRVGYARALAALEELRLAPAPFALAATGAPLLPRIRRLAGKSARTPGRPAWPLAGLIVLLLFAALALGLHSHRAQARDRASDPVNPPLTHPGVVKSETTPPPAKSTSLDYDRLPPSTAGNPEIFTQTFHLDPSAFRRALEDFEAVPSSAGLPNSPHGQTAYNRLVQGDLIYAPGVNVTTNAPVESMKVRQFFSAAGLDLDMDHQANLGKAVFWKERKGLLMVRATRQELDRVEAALAKLNVPPPPDEIKSAAISSPLPAVIKSETLPPPAKSTSLNYDRLPPSSAGKPELVTQVFHLDPNAFRLALADDKYAPPADASPTDAFPNILADWAGDDGDAHRPIASVQPVRQSGVASAEAKRLNQFLMSAGMDLDPNNPANLGKAMFWSDRKGKLMLHGTRPELDAVEAALAKLNLPPPPVETKPAAISSPLPASSNLVKPKPAVVPQINVQIKIVEVDAGPDGSALAGVMENSLPAQPATGQSPDSPRVPKPFFAPKVFSDPKRPVTNSIIRQMTGILTGEQARQVIAALERREGVDILTPQSVTTESGRQAQMQIGEMQTVVTGLTTSSGPSRTNLYTTENIPLGPVVDIVPRVSPDGKIELVVIANVTEFLGYDKPDRAQAAAFPGATLPLPHFRLRKMSTSASVPDGGTLVLGGVEDERVVEVQDKVPVLGDIPVAGRLFRSTSKHKTRKNLLIFITPYLINPDGSRFNPDPSTPPSTR